MIGNSGGEQSRHEVRPRSDEAHVSMRNRIGTVQGVGEVRSKE